MTRKVKIWKIGNTGLRSPNRIPDGFRIYSESKYVGNLHGPENEIGFMKLLNEKGIIQNSEGKDLSGSHSRKWRLMFAKNGLIYPQANRRYFDQEDLGNLDDITPFGEMFLKADTVPAVQECFLRSMSVEQYEVQDTDGFFSPLRWILAIMIELEKETNSSELSRIEFALWGQTTDPSYEIDEVVKNIISLRKRRENAKSKRVFDRKEIENRRKYYDKKSDNFLDYGDMNMRYLRSTGIFQRKGRGLIITPSKRSIAEKMASSGLSREPLISHYKTLCTGAPLPIDDIDDALVVLKELQKYLDSRNIVYDLSDLSLTTATEVNIARRRLELILNQSNEIQYASQQKDAWYEITNYMSMLITNRDRMTYDDDNFIEIPRSETAVYLEWVIWRSILALGKYINKPYEIRGFSVDADFMPVSVAPGGKGDLYAEYKDYVILNEVTMSTGSRQEATEGESVRRHVADAVNLYPDKKVYGLFIGKAIDTNTAEAFRRGVWYNDNLEVCTDIVPLTIEQYHDYFEMLFKKGEADPSKIRDLIVGCMTRKAILTAPSWKDEISSVISDKVNEMEYGLSSSSTKQFPLVVAGAKIEHSKFGKGTVIAVRLSFVDDSVKSKEFPFTSESLGKLSYCPEPNYLYHDDFGKGQIVSFTVLYQNDFVNAIYPEDFVGTAVKIEAPDFVE